MLINDQTHLDRYIREHVNLLVRYSSFIKDIGLIDGKVGISVFLHKYIQQNQDETICVYADELLEEVVTEITSTVPVSIEKGLAGIGIGILYLIKIGCISGDSDELLEELDSFIDQSLNTSIHLEEDDYFVGNYFVLRYSMTLKKRMIRKILSKTVEILYLKLRLLKKSPHKNFKMSSKMLHSILYFLINCIENNIKKAKAKAIFQLLTLEIEKKIDSATLDADQFIILQLLDQFNELLPDEENVITKFVSHENWVVDFTLLDFIVFARNKLFYYDYIELSWRGLLSKRLDESICPKNLLDQFLSNLSLSNMSLNYYATGLSWAMLNKFS